MRELPLERCKGELKILLERAPFGLALNDYVGDEAQDEVATMRVAIYPREPTEDKGEDPENKLRDLCAWCTVLAMSWSAIR